MKAFVKSLFLFGFLVILILIVIACAIDISGWSDWAYRRLRSSGEKSLIIGTSHANQGVHPDIIDKELSGYGYSYPIFNFAFSANNSPYGEVYFNAIREKLSNEDYHDGLFILAVDPWALSLGKADEQHYREQDGILVKSKPYICPNILYLWNYCRPIIPIILPDNRVVLRDNGWVEVSVPPIDSDSARKRLGPHKEGWAISIGKKSEYRLRWLSKTISFLKQKGTVFLVWIPTSPIVREIDNSIWPEFEQDMTTLSKKFDIDFISFKCGKYRTTDGFHLHKDAGAIFTKDMCDSIKTRIDKKN